MSQHGSAINKPASAFWSWDALLLRVELFFRHRRQPASCSLSRERDQRHPSVALLHTVQAKR